MRWHLNHRVHGNKPWEVQLEAMRRGAKHPRYGYFLEQGLGKTSLTLNDFVEFSNRGLVDLMVVFAPQTFKNDWALAPKEWGVGHYWSGVWPHDPPPFEQEAGVYAINYEASRAGRGREMLEDLLTKRKCMLTVDESTDIKSPSSLNAKSTIIHAKQAKIVRELNGTPLVQNVMDYYAQLRVLGELNGVNPVAFRNRFAILGGYMGKKVQREFKNEAELYAILDRCSFRALKKDWRPDLPPQLDIPVHIEMTAKQQKHYNEMMEEFYTIVEGAEVTAEIVLTQYDKLRQISSCLALAEGKANWIEPPEKNPKVKATLEIMAAGQNKTIVVYFYRDSGNMLYEVLKREKQQPAYLRGQMKPDEITREKDRFNNDPTCRSVVVQIAAHCRGHDLLGSEGIDRCTRTVFYENSFSLWHRLQMRDRNHRGAQDQPCNYFDPITSPMDQFMIDTLTGKREMADAVDEIVKIVKASKQRKH